MNFTPGVSDFTLASHGRFTQAEMLAAEKWRSTYIRYLKSIYDDDTPDGECESAKQEYLRGLSILEAQDLTKPYCKRKRVVHAVNAFCVYGEPDELGDPELLAAAVKAGLADLAKSF